MKIFKIIIILFLVINIQSCKKKSEFSIETIKLPKYYQIYNERKYWEKQGVLYKYSFIPYNRKGHYKDSCSQNFLSINEISNGILNLKTNERIEIMKDEFKASVEINNENYEIYKSKQVEEINKRKIYYYGTYFFIKRDSACFSIEYSTINNDPVKKNDYNKIVYEIRNECIIGSFFKPTLKQNVKKKVIAN